MVGHRVLSHTVKQAVTGDGVSDARWQRAIQEIAQTIHFRSEVRLKVIKTKLPAAFEIVNNLSIKLYGKKIVILY